MVKTEGDTADRGLLCTALSFLFYAGIGNAGGWAAEKPIRLRNITTRERIGDAEEKERFPPAHAGDYTDYKRGEYTKLNGRDSSL